MLGISSGFLAPLALKLRLSASLSLVHLRMSHLMSPPTPPSEPHSPLAPAPNTHPDLTAAGSQQPAAAAPAAADVDDEMASPSSSSSSEPEDTLEMDVGPSSFLNSARAFVSRSTKRASGRGRGKRGGKDERAAKKGKKGEEEFGGAGLGLRNGEGAEDKLLDKDAYDAMVEGQSFASTIAAEA